MKKIYIIIFACLMAALLLVLSFYFFTKETGPSLENYATTSPVAAVKETEKATTTVNDFLPPLDKSEERVTKKKFGIYITKQNSPVKPERFSGYHTGVDFEIFPDELTKEVPVKAVCTGKLVLKKLASGYGGVAVEECALNNEPITIIYGHLNLGSVNKKIGDNINIGEKLGILGKGFSSETDSERKHLHLGVHKGKDINIKGYVSVKEDLSGWLDLYSLIFN